jgi:hypothetical protein
MLYIGAGRTCSAAILSVWEAGCADLRDHWMPDGTHLADFTALDLIRQSGKLHSVADFRGAYMARLPRPPGQNRSDLRELEVAVNDRPASRETTRFWASKCRQQLEQSRGPLAHGLRQMVSMPRADEPYFADQDGSDPLMRWYGDEPPAEAPKGEP